MSEDVMSQTDKEAYRLSDKILKLGNSYYGTLQLAIHFCKKYGDPKDVLPILIKYNQEKISPPMSQQILLGILQEAVNIAPLTDQDIMNNLYAPTQIEEPNG